MHCRLAKAIVKLGDFNSGSGCDKLFSAIEDCIMHQQQQQQQQLMFLEWPK